MTTTPRPLEFRELRTAAELAPLPEFEVRIWGGEHEMVSINVLVATISEGGMAIGAFAGEALVGAVYGFATSDPTVHHSHYLAVAPEMRRHGLGVELKHRQRAWCLARGITAMRWTYDPLQLGNARFNLHTLGAVGIAYHVDHYGTLGGINGSLPSDRLTVRWDLAAPRWTGSEQIEVEVPAVSVAQIAAAASAAIAARLEVRDALETRLAAGWRITDVELTNPRYVLQR